MSDTMNAQGDDPILEKAKQLRAAGASIDQIKQYLASKGYDTGTGAPATAGTTGTAHDIHAEYRSGRLAGRMARENANDQDAAASASPSYAEQALGGIASLVRDIPGAEAAQAGARALVRGQSYRDALGDIRGAEDSAPSVVRNYNRIAGGLVAGAAMPSSMSGAAQGAAYGAASGALQSNPDAGIGQRIGDAAVGAGVGGVVGKVGDAASNAVRAAVTKRLGQQAMDRQAVTRAIDTRNYGRAAQEATAAGGTSPAIQAALQASDIAPFADAVRTSRTFQGADDATVLREAYKLMSERQGTLANRLINANDFKAGTSLENADMGAAKRQLLTAAQAPTPTGQSAIATAQSPAPDLRTAISDFWSRPGIALARQQGTVAQQMARTALERHAAENIVSPSLSGAPPEELLPGVMPSFPMAVEQHAEQSGLRDAMRNGADATKRLLSGAHVAGKKLETNSPEAFLSTIGKMTPDQAGESLSGVLGRTKEYMGASANPLTGFGLGSSLINAARVSPFVQALDQQAGGAPVPTSFLRAFLTSQGHPSP